MNTKPIIYFLTFLLWILAWIATVAIVVYSSISVAEVVQTTNSYTSPITKLESSERRTLVMLTKLLMKTPTSKFSPEINKVKLSQSQYLITLGLFNEAIKHLNNIIATEIDPGMLDEAWYLLASIYFLQHDHSNVETSLAQIKSSLAPSQDNRRWYYLITSLIEMRQLNRAITVVNTMPAHLPGKTYALFKVGVAFFLNEKYETAAILFNQIAQSASSELEQKELIDRAKFFLSEIALISNQSPVSSPESTAQDPPSKLSNQALLRTGWTWFNSLKFNNALHNWGELQSRDEKHVAVQEVFLATPLAFIELDKLKTAAAYYKKALKVYRSILNELEISNKIVHGGEFVRGLKSIRVPNSRLEIETVDYLPTTIDKPFLKELYVSNEFQKAVQAYLLLKLIKRKLGDKKKNIPVEIATLKRKQKALVLQLPEMSKMEKQVLQKELTLKRDQLSHRLASINQSTLNSTQKEQIAANIVTELGVVESKLLSLGKTAGNSTINNSKLAKSHQISREDHGSQIQTLESLERTLPKYIDTLTDLQAKQAQYIQSMVTNFLNFYKTRLNGFIEQASYGQVRVWDLLVSNVD